MTLLLIYKNAIRFNYSLSLNRGSISICINLTIKYNFHVFSIGNLIFNVLTKNILFIVRVGSRHIDICSYLIFKTCEKYVHLFLILLIHI